MHEQTRESRDDSAERKLHLGQFFQSFCLCKHSRESDAGERDGIIEQKLRGMHDGGVLKGLQHAVDQPREHPLFGAEHKGIKHEGKQGSDGNRAALGHFHDTEIGEGEAHGYADRRVSDGLRIEAFFILSAEEQRRRGDGCDQQSGAHVKRGGIDVVVAVGQPAVGRALSRGEVDPYAHERGDQRRADRAARRDIGRFASF